MKALLRLYNGDEKLVTVKEERKDKVMSALMPPGIDYSEVDYIDFGIDLINPQAGDNGYFVIPHGETGLKDSILCKFRQREYCEVIVDGPVMPMFGVITDTRSFMAAVSGMTYDCQLVAGFSEKGYYIFPRFIIHGRTPYEPICVEYHDLDAENPDYNDVAKAYRTYQIKKGNIRPIKERIKEQPCLDYAKDAIYIRIRQGWKPVPPPVLEQTIETEPEMKVACDFASVSALLDELKKQGIDKAEICLVGWNISGHDGRWPQAFPVEPKLGGEESLRKLIQKAKRLGYQIVCHTNSSDAYSIADCWNKDDIIVKEDGTVSPRNTWSGGAMYELCPNIALKQAEEILPKVADLGFKGIHYIDVLSTIKPRSCYHPKHPSTARDTVRTLREIMKLSKDLFGGFSSEGGYDFAAPYLDYGLYISFGQESSPLADKAIPLWQIVYHGYIMGNPYTTTVNPSYRDMLKVIEYGGRPVAYFYSQFVTPTEGRGNWMGDQDYTCGSEKERVTSVSRIKETYELYKKISFLQTEFIERHEEIADNVYRTMYSNGVETIVDYNNEEFKIIPNQL